MSSYPAHRLAPVARPQLFIPRRPQRFFAYECGSYIPSARSFAMSLIVHVIGIWFLAPVVFQAHIRIESPAEIAVSDQLVVLYVPELPKLESHSQSTSTLKPSTTGALSRSMEQSVRATLIVSDPAEVLIAPQDIQVQEDPSTLASILSSTPQAIKLGPQAIEIASGSRRSPETAPKLPLNAIPVKAPSISIATTNAKLGPQPIEIVSGQATQKTVEPIEIPSSALPTANPSLPVNAGTSVRLVDAPAINSGSSTARLIGSPSGPAPSVERPATGVQGNAGLNVALVQSPSSVRLIDAPAIKIGSRTTRMVGSPSGPAPSVEGSIVDRSGNTGLNVVLGQIGAAVILNPNGGPRVGTAPQQQGRIAASIVGLPLARGLGMPGGGPSDGRGAGTLPTENADGVPGAGSRGIGDRPGAGVTGSGPNSVAIDSSVVNIGSFGPPPTVNGPLHGRRPSVVIVSSAGAGTTLQRFAKTLKGQVYTIYLNAAGTPAVMQFAEQRSARQNSFSPDLVAPESISTAMPKNLPSGEEVVSCVLTKEGKLDAIRVLSEISPEQTEVVVSALKQWRFRPAYREDLAVDVDVLIGFGVGTN